MRMFALVACILVFILIAVVYFAVVVFFADPLTVGLVWAYPALRATSTQMRPDTQGMTS